MLAISTTSVISSKRLYKNKIKYDGKAAPSSSVSTADVGYTMQHVRFEGGQELKMKIRRKDGTRQNVPAAVEEEMDALRSHFGTVHIGSVLAESNHTIISFSDLLLTPDRYWAALKRTFNLAHFEILPSRVNGQRQSSLLPQTSSPATTW